MIFLNACMYVSVKKTKTASMVYTKVLSGYLWVVR